MTIITGTAENDELDGFPGDDEIYGLAGVDTLRGKGGDDQLYGGDNGDLLDGGIGLDLLLGEGGDDLLLGQAGTDALFGGDGDDELKGGKGDDHLNGGLGQDDLWGGKGSDVFDYNEIAESPVGAGLRDRILDFKSYQGDLINLSGIDANGDASDGDQEFTYIYAAAFSLTPGELRFDLGILSADVNGDGVADLQIEVAGVGTLLEPDFFL